MYKRQVYHEGAVMCNLFLADEINRTSPKTQSALLEVMEEGNVTVEGISRKVPEPFIAVSYTHLDVYKRQACQWR